MNVSAMSGRLNTCDQRIARWPWRSGVREPRRGGTSKRRGCRATVRARGYHVKATSLPRPSCEGDESAPHSSRRRRSCLSHTARSRGWRARSGVAARLETGLPRAPAPAAATGVCAPSTRGASVARPKAYASSKSPASLQSPSSTSTICTGRVGARRVAHGPTGASLTYVGLLARGASHQTTKGNLTKMARHSLVRPPNATALCDPLNWGGPTIKGKPPGRRLSATSTLSRAVDTGMCLHGQQQVTPTVEYAEHTTTSTAGSWHTRRPRRPGPREPAADGTLGPASPRRGGAPACA